MSEPKIKVIGAGLSRTGTKSLRQALETLLEEPCAHGFDIVDFNKKENELWPKVAEGKDNVQDWIDYFETRDCATCCDSPFGLNFEKILSAYPDAKVVLTIRDPLEWRSSMQKTVLHTFKMMDTFPISLGARLGMSKRLMGVKTTEKVMQKTPPEFSHPCNQLTALESDVTSQSFFNAWTEYVKKKVPKDQLLIFRVTEGWEPLCNFLQVPIPEKPFPRLNDKNDIDQRLKRAKTQSCWTILYLLLIPIMVAILWKVVMV